MIKHMASFLLPNNFEFFHVNFTCLLKKLDDTLIDNPGMHFVYAHKNEIWNLFPIYCSNFQADNLSDLKYALEFVEAIFTKLLEPILLGKHRSAENDLNGMREA